MRNGRPLRFLTVTIAGWTAVRIGMLWPDALPPGAAVAARSPSRVGEARPALIQGPGLAALWPAPPVSLRPLPLRPGPVAGPALVERYAAGAPRNPVLVTLALAGLMRFDGAQRAEDWPVRRIPPPLPPAPIASAPGRFAGSAWLLTRGGSKAGLLGGELGGSQAGLRVTYALGQARRLALAARVATPLNGQGRGRGREAALGVEWRPTTAPIRLVAEERFGLDGGTGGPTLMAIGGIGPTRVAAGFSLESYAQAGAIARNGVEFFADGAARLTHPIARVAGLTLDAGVGSWGAAQRGAARLDVGPSLGLAVPVGRSSLRLTLDYRRRVGGDARPGSGVALSLGSDF